MIITKLRYSRLTDSRQQRAAVSSKNTFMVSADPCLGYIYRKREYLGMKLARERTEIGMLSLDGRYKKKAVIRKQPTRLLTSGYFDLSTQGRRYCIVSLKR